jgi:hypothetical protein
MREAWLSMQKKKLLLKEKGKRGYVKNIPVRVMLDAELKISQDNANGIPPG